MRKKIDIAKEYGEQIATSLFKDFFEHPEYRGAKFAWMKFGENFVYSYTAGQVGMNLWWKNRSEKLLEKCQTIASEAAKAKWDALVKENGLENA